MFDTSAHTALFLHRNVREKLFFAFRAVFADAK
jgi:hypothetical protein